MVILVYDTPGPEALKFETQLKSLPLLLTAIVPVSIPQYCSTCAPVQHYYISGQIQRCKSWLAGIRVCQLRLQEVMGTSLHS